MSSRLIIDQPFLDRARMQEFRPNLIVASAGATEPLYQHRPDQAMECGVAALGDTVVFAGIISRDNVASLGRIVERADRLQIVGHNQVTNRISRNARNIYEQGLHCGTARGAVDTDLELLFLAALRHKINLNSAKTAGDVKDALAHYYRAYGIERRTRLSHIFADAILHHVLDK